MTNPKVGDTFAVKKQYDFREGDELVARYLPGSFYRVTERNRSFVGKLGGEAVFGEAAAALNAGASRLSTAPGKASGRVTVGARRKGNRK